MIRALQFALAGALLASPALSTPPIMTPPAPAAPPSLTLVIGVDGLSSNLFDRYRASFAGGFARLGSGARFEIEGQGVMIGGLSEAVKLGRPGSQALLVSAIPGFDDQSANQRWTLASGRFDPAGPGAAPPIAAQANAAIERAIATPQPALEAPPECAAPPLATGGKRFARAGGDLPSYRASPELDGATLAFALALARDLGLGSTSARADVVEIGLRATGAVAGAYGSSSQEMCLNLLSLDRDLGDAFAYLDRTGVDYAVVLAGLSEEPPAPLLFWRKGWVSPQTGGPARRVDVIPTIAAMVGAGSNSTGTGTCLSGMPGIICPLKR